ncbi:MAG: DUF3343 domain-containing protein [bacterium]|jgi:hypothetical protein
MSREYQILFFTHTGAIRFERAMQKENIPCALMPVPRALSSSCSVSALIRFAGSADDLIDDQIEKIFQYHDDKYILIYAAEE